MQSAWGPRRLLHDLRSPIEAAAGSLELLETRHARDLADAAPLLRLARASLDEARALLRHPAPASHPLPLEETDPEHALRHVLAEVGSRGRGVRVDPLLPVRAHPLALRRVLRNLLDNALAHADQGVRVSAEREAHAVRLSVADDGPGIALRDQWRILLPRQDGHGLGLFNTLRLVDEMGGQLWIDSAPGRGTTVHFTLLPAR